MESASKQIGERKINSGGRTEGNPFPLPPLQILKVINQIFFQGCYNLHRLEKHLPRPQQAAHHFILFFPQIFFDLNNHEH